MFPITDHVTLLKSDGTRHEKIPAHVQPRTIFIDNASVPIEEGDRILRTLPNKFVESYLVEDRGFYPATGGFSDHYQVKVRKESAPPSNVTSIVYNLHGPNSRVNIHSADSSTNVVNISETNLFVKLREALQSIEDLERREVLLGSVDEMEKAKGTPGFAAKYRNFIAQAADHMTLLQPFIVPLTQLISG